MSPEEMRSEAYKANSGGNAAKYVSQRQSIFYSNLVLEKRDCEFFSTLVVKREQELHES